jgi:hypothetical protein
MNIVYRPTARVLTVLCDIKHKMDQESVATSSHQGSQPSTPWRVRFFRGLWSVLRFVWVVLIGGIVVGIIVTLSTATTDTPLSKLNIIQFVACLPHPGRL